MANIYEKAQLQLKAHDNALRDLCGALAAERAALEAQLRKLVDRDLAYMNGTVCHGQLQRSDVLQARALLDLLSKNTHGQELDAVLGAKHG
jgi:hypothetical protein